MRIKPCWNCGKLPKCERCGSTERRKGNKGCAECHRRHSREQAARNQPPADDTDIELTPAALAYLRAFDAWLQTRDRATLKARRKALQRLEGDV